ncbi:aminopeptidase P family protein [Limibaculum sp. M0105]|uniref:Aminopeptidase P family protein n=1 Tax=Thermohalobaculum xanthum TaxID=2753746 RepID=A0A8J7M7F2_9RHOB|nr:aminopeptidase P family protein [Thermohalobaculum xanthum]MBK0399683.1 aminopeptidase P family protein [Thermohalobaculum xanthum]
MYQTFDSAADGSMGPERAARLRAALIETGVDGFLVPRADAHQGETVAPHDERLAWLTGFTGSAGLAIVLAERAAIFVDGRYTLQAADQVDGGVFEVVATHETTPESWLRRALPEGARLGFDPWLHGRAEFDRLNEAVSARGGALVPLEPNPLDTIWEDQPPSPTGAVSIQPAELAGEAAAEKRALVGRALEEGGIDAAFLSLPDSIAWLLNIRGGDLARSPVAHCFALIRKSSEVDLFIDPDKLDGAVMAHLGNGVTVHPADALDGVLAGLGDAKVRLDRTSAPVRIATRLETAGARIDWGRDPCALPKARKNPAELAGMRAAHLRDGAAFARFLHWLETAVDAGEALTEIDVVERLEAFRDDTGALMDIAFDTICGSGPNGAIVHYRVNRKTNRALSPGELLLVDSGAQYRDGTTDITRTMALGAAPDAARRPFTLVLKGMIAISRARWPKGLTGRDLDPLARAALWRAGLDYDHGTGHGVGCYLNVHEGPQSLSRRGGEVPFEPGMILSNEPGYYRNGAFGIRIENLVVVTEPSIPEGGDRTMLGFETLTLAPIDRRMIVPDLLDADERAWLDSYHARVRDELSPVVPAETAAWLSRACAPLDTQ